MQIKIIIKGSKKLLKKILIVLLILYCFYSYGLQPFFIWKTFAKGIFTNILDIPYRSIIGFLITIIGLIYIYQNKIKKINFIFATWILGAGILTLLAGGYKHIISFEILLYIVPAVYILLPDYIQKSVYKIYYNIFVYSLVIPIIIYIFVHIGIEIPYITLEAPEPIKTYLGIYYKLYPFAIQWNHDYSPFYYALRLCGIFNEPGVVGTFSALFLCVENYELKRNWKNIILLIAGILSFSLAFYLLTVIFFITQIVSLKQKRIVIVLFLVLTYIIFINIPISNENIAKFQRRLTITSAGLIGNNRTATVYDDIFKDFLNGNKLRVVFGYGTSAIEDTLEDRNIDSCTYKNLIYDYGILGFVGQILWIIFYALQISKGKRRNDKLYVITFIMLFLANMYQRPYMFALQYYAIYIGGVKYKLNKS